MYQYEISIVDEYCELLLSDLARELGVFFDKSLYMKAVHEKNSKSLDNLFILSNQECTVYANCNIRDWLYSVVVVGKGQENRQIADILIKWNTKCRMEYGQKIYDLENVYGKNETSLKAMCEFYNYDITKLGKTNK